ncbi:hypothetical protein BAUCODRAFT_45477, partial [Baudoinia panamericana UAMH 10762]
HKLQDAPSYQAVSYTWGDTTLTKDIVCDNKRLQVTENCELALRALRSTQDTVCVWIDAICINQKDDRERSEQVTRMGDIYHAANQVIIHLPPADDCSTFTIDTIHSYEHLDRGSTASVLQSYHSDFDRSVAHWQSLFSRRWFSRMWVLQEIILARE